MNIKIKPAHRKNYTEGRSKPIQYLVIHYTANNGDTALGNCNYFQKAGRNASAHYFVDENEIYQSVDDSNAAWHCGANTYYHKYCRNSNSIGVELCSRNEKEDKSGKYYFKKETVDNAVKLVKYLMEKYGIKAENVVRHYDVTHKNCPEPFVRDTAAWEDFKKRLEISREVLEVKKTIDVVVNGEKGYTNGYFADGKNLFTADFIRQLGFEAGYDPVTKAVSFDGNGIKKAKMIVNGQEKELATVFRDNLNHVSLQDLKAAGAINVSFKDGKVYIDSVK